MYWRQVVAVATNDISANPKGIEEFRGSFSGYERDHLYYNPSTGGRFVDLGYSFGLDFDDDGRSFAPVDIDGDGDLDLPMLSLQGLRLMENTLEPGRRRFARFRLKATKTQHHALGAEVIVTAGGVTQRDYVKLNAGFQTQVPLELHFGLGAAERLDTVEVRWPSGAVATHRDLPAGKLIQLTEGAEPRIEAVRAWPEATRPAPVGTHDLTVGAQDLDGAQAPVAAIDGTPTVVNFWAPWCAPCQRELPVLRKLAAQFEGAVRFVGVSVETKDIASVRAAIAEHRLGYGQRLATPAVLQSFFGGDGRAPLPSTFVFDGRGRLRRAVHRAVQAEDLTDLLASFGAKPRTHQYLLPMAEVELQRRNLPGARKLLDEAHAIAPDAPMVLAQLGAVMNLQGEVEASLPLLERATKLDPGIAYAWYRLGQSYKKKGRFEDALAAFQKARSLRPTEASYLMGVGAMHSRLKDNEAAAKVFDQLVARAPDDVDAWLNLAKTRLLLRQRDPAIIALNRVLTLAPGHPEAQRLLDLAERAR